MTNALRPVVGLVTIGQSPRPDIVPDMAAIIGPGVDIREAGALDGLTRAEVDALKPTGDDEILVTRLTDGTGVFVGKQKIVRLVEERIARLERDGLSSPRCSAPAPSRPARHALADPAAARAVRHAPRDVVARPARHRHPVRPARAADRGALAR